MEVSPWPKSTNQCSDPKKKSKKNAVELRSFGVFWALTNVGHLYILDSRAETGGNHQLLAERHWGKPRLMAFHMSNETLNGKVFFGEVNICIEKPFYITCDTQQAIDFYTFTFIHIYIYLYIDILCMWSR